MLRIWLIALSLSGPALARTGDQTGRMMTATSLDGRYFAEVSTMRPVFCGPDGQGSTDNALHTLLVSDRRTGRPVAGFSAGRSSDWDDRTTAFATPKFSPDARSIYIVGRLTLCETGTWRDKPHVFRIDVRDADPRPAHFVAAGRLIAIVRSGPHAGCLLVQQQGTVGRDPVVLFSPTGVRIRAIPGSDRVGKAATGPWLKAQGWRVY